MKVRLLQAFALPDGIRALAGQTLENVPPNEALQWIREGKAEALEEIGNREPEIESRDPQGGRKARHRARTDYTHG